MKLPVFALLAATAVAFDAANIISIVNSNNASTWKAGEPAPFAGWTREQLKGLCGTIMPNRTLTPNPKARKLDIPTSFDARDKWPSCKSIKMVRDQGNCGSCWAFGAAEAFSDRYCIASGATQQPIFSPYALMTCSELNQGCNGGILSLAWQFIKSNGLPLDACQPYVGVDGSTPACNWGRCTAGGSWQTWKVSSTSSPGCGWFSCDADAMATEIMTNGPIEGSFTVYEDFMTYKSGVYRHTTGAELGGHAIKIIGWGVENGTPYWLCTNSWSTTWGDNGFFKILRGSNECGIESNNAAGTPIVQ